MSKTRKRYTREFKRNAVKLWQDSGKSASDIIHHSDRGSQYTSDEYEQLLATYHFQPSLGRIGSCFDNAATESFFGTLKSEWLYFHRLDTREQAMQSIFYYIEVFYNRQRLHSANGYYSPA